MNTVGIFNQGITELNLGNPKKALSIFNKILELEPDNINALLKKGNILGKFGKYTESILIYDKVLSIESQNILALVNKGLALHYLARYDEAIACFDVVLKTNPNNTIALYNMASSLIKHGKTSEGLKILERTIKIDYSFKYKAKLDIDFQHILLDNNFKKLIS